MDINFKQGKAYWESLSFDERISILRDGEFFEGFANYIWEYLIILVQIYVSRRAKEINYRYEN